MFRVATTAFFTASLLSACSLSVGSTPTSAPSSNDASSTAPEATPPIDAGESAEADEAVAPTRANPADAPSQTPPKVTASSYAEGLSGLDKTDPDAFASAVALFLEFHPPTGTRASTVRMDLQTFLDFVATTTATVDQSIRESSGLMAAACESAGFDCGVATAEDRTALEAFANRGVRFAYGGEGTFEVAVDHALVQTALEPALDEPSTMFLGAMHASARLSESFDEGSFAGKPSLAVDALTRWEQLVAAPGPYAASAPKEAAAARESYLRLCFDGEHQSPPCQANKALRASYAQFATAHADSPSAPAVALFRRTLRSRRWKATAAELDAMVEKALAATP